MKNSTKILSLVASAALVLTSCSSLGGSLGGNSGNSGSIGGNLGSLGGIFGGSNGSSSGSSTGASAAGDVLGALLGDLIGNNIKVTDRSLVGTWSYQKPDCRFESENYLAKAGGAAAATKVEAKLTSIYSGLGIKQGNCYFTFNADKTCQVKLGVMSFNGTWSLNQATSDLSIVSNTKLIKLNCKIYNDLGGITLLFDTTKLLSLLQSVGSFAGGANSTIGALSSLLNEYDGMMVGMNLQK